MKLNTKDQDIFFMSDPHFGHKNICKATSSWSDTTECRDFISVEAMDSYIIDQINRLVGEDDILFVLGDWSFGGEDNIWKSRIRINCKNIHFIIGNHDHHIERGIVFKGAKREEPYGKIIPGKPIGGEYPDYVSVDAPDMFSSISHYKRISIDGQEIVMSHFPMIAWDRSHKGSWMLHGHSHGTLFTDAATQWAGSDYWYKTSKILDVGVDSIFKIFGEYKPLKFQEIRKIMNKREVIFNDHHDQNTN